MKFKKEILLKNQGVFDEYSTIIIDNLFSWPFTRNEFQSIMIVVVTNKLE